MRAVQANWLLAQDSCHGGRAHGLELSYLGTALGPYLSSM